VLSGDDLLPIDVAPVKLNLQRLHLSRGQIVKNPYGRYNSESLVQIQRSVVLIPRAGETQSVSHQK